MSQAATWLTARVQNVVTAWNAFTGEEIPWKTY
jgi:hypothetical protein